MGYIVHCWLLVEGWALLMRDGDVGVGRKAGPDKCPAVESLE